MSWLEFKNILSTDMGIVPVSLGRRQKAEEQIDTFEIPYRNDELTIHSNTYKPYLREMELALTDKAKISLVNKWLNGQGKLRTSKDEGGYFIASVITGLPYEQMVNEVNSFQVGFKVNPFFYLDEGDYPLEFTGQSKIFNPGTIYSEPYIKITGSGDVDLIINSKIYSFKGIDGYIEVDSALKLVYKDTLNQGDKMTGEFPLINEEENIIAWTGNVSKLEIIPKWREL